MTFRKQLTYAAGYAGTLLLAAGLIAAASLFAGCSLLTPEGDQAAGKTLRLHDGTRWTAGFADYPSNTPETDYELVADVRPLPDTVGRQEQAIYLAGNNHSDDLFMFIKRRVEHLQPNTSYALTFSVELASNAPAGCMGVGGAPGEGVTLKAGASVKEPLVEDRGGSYLLNVDKGQQVNGGRDAVVLGDITNGDACEAGARYRLIQRDNAAAPFEVTADAEGRLWIFVGTDSGFEATTALYYSRVNVTFTPVTQEGNG